MNDDGPDDGASDGDGRDDSGTADAAPRPMAWWDDVRADMHARAEAYETEGWETLELHPGDVAAVDGEFGGDVELDVLLPDDEFAALTDTLADVTVDGYEVYRSVVEGYVVALLVAEASADDVAVFVPVFYALGDPSAKRLLSGAVEAGELTVSLRELSNDSVELTLSEPALLVPDGYLDGE